MKFATIVILAGLLSACAKDNCGTRSTVTAVSNCSQGFGNIACDYTTANGTTRINTAPEFTPPSVGSEICTN